MLLFTLQRELYNEKEKEWTRGEQKTYKTSYEREREKIYKKTARNIKTDNM